MNKERLETENAVITSSQCPAVITNFSGYTPPFDAVPIVESMLASVPPKYLIGLSEIVLTNASGLPRKLRRSMTRARKHKVKIVEAGGLYHQAWHGNQAWIEIFVDNILKRWEKGWWLKISRIREILLGDVLFHEIGHHIHFTIRPEYKEKEDVADSWKVRLKRQYNRVHHKWLRTFLYPLRPLFITLSRLIRKYQLKRGWISRGEFEEDLKRSASPKK